MIVVDTRLIIKMEILFTCFSKIFVRTYKDVNLYANNKFYFYCILVGFVKKLITAQNTCFVDMVLHH